MTREGIADALNFMLGVCLVGVFFTTFSHRYRRVGRTGFYSGTRQIARAIGIAQLREMGRVSQTERSEGVDVHSDTREEAHESYASACAEERSPVVPLVPEDLVACLQQKFPGMEHYWISSPYSSTKYIPSNPIRPGKRRNPHADHGGFIYVGFLDSLLEPHQARVFRSTSLAGLLRLIEAERADFIPDILEYPLVKRRFKL
jgi:hypothetical protein